MQCFMCEFPFYAKFNLRFRSVQCLMCDVRSVQCLMCEVPHYVMFNV